MLNPNELKIGDIILYNKELFEILEIKHLHLGRGGAVFQTKIRNLKTNSVFSQNFKPGDRLEEADIEEEVIRYLYNHRGEYFFCKKENPSERFSLNEEMIGKYKFFLKSGIDIEAIKFQNKIINIILPIKIDLKVTEAPPNFSGNTVDRGTKKITLETGYEVSAPLFIKEGDIVRINTKTGEYVERIK